MTLVKITDHASVVRRADVGAFYFNFTAWADAGPPSDFSLLVRDRDDDMATGIIVLNPDYSDQHTRFWAMLIKAARTKFSYSTPSGTRFGERGGFGAGHRTIPGGVREDHYRKRARKIARTHTLAMARSVDKVGNVRNTGRELMLPIDLP
jgi:hypothetical protein